MWLDDGIKDLWMCGVDVRDAIMIKNLNSKAKITIDTPVGMTEEFEIENIVKQGTVYAVDICGAVTDNINKTGYGVITMYGPDLVINALAFVDDIVSAGSPLASNNTIQSCNMMEEKKKITFNTDHGKSAVMKSNKKRYNNSITKEVKKGSFEEVKEYKLLGVWVDETGRYMINTKKNRKRERFMTNNVKSFANQHNMGQLAICGRLKMLDAVVMKALLHGVEAYPTITKEELNELERMQGRIIRDLVEVPPTTPYNALLLELGLPTMKARVEYRKLMLYHNLVNSDEKRIARKVVEVQREMDRNGTWLSGVQKIMKNYGIEDTTSEDVKSTWKKKVKERIREKTEESIRANCENQSKARTVMIEKYELKDYLKKAPVAEAKQILKARLHMMKLPCNYGRKDESCWLCGSDGEVTTEHYYRCIGAKGLQRNWNAKEEDLQSTNRTRLIRTTKFLEQVEEIFKPKWETSISPKVAEVQNMSKRKTK